MEADGNPNNDTEKEEGSAMEHKLDIDDRHEEVKVGCTDHSPFANGVSKQDIAKLENEYVKAHSTSNNSSNIAKQTGEISEDSTNFGIPLENLKQCNVTLCQGKENNMNNSVSGGVMEDETIIARNAVNCEEKIALQWDANILDSVADADLVCSEIENYLKNNLNLPNVPRRETQSAKPDLTTNNSTNELFKTSAEVSNANNNYEKVETLTSVEQTIFDKLAGTQSKLDLCSNTIFGHHKSTAEMNSDIGSSNFHDENFPISFAGITTCESIEKKERLKAMTGTSSSCSNSEKSTDHQNTLCEVAAKPTSTIDFLSGSFRNEETLDSHKEKHKSRNMLRNVVVARLSAKNINESSKIAEKDNMKVKESTTSVVNDGLQSKEEHWKVTESEADSMMCMQTVSSDSEEDSSDFSFNSSTFDDSDDSSSTVSAISKKKDNNSGDTMKWHQLKTKGELGLEDLPPIEDLHISVEKEELEEMGVVTSFVEELVIVQANHGQRALDLDSVLFLEGGKLLGQVFDVFGPVVQPSYAIRFNSTEEIASKGITKGCAVFSAPKRTEITKFVFAEKLSREKGSDASWENNNEPPEQHLDYSDDEKEKEAKKRGKPNNATVKRDEKPLAVNMNPPLRPPVFQVPRLPPNLPHPGFPFGPPPPLPPFASRFPGAPVFGALPFNPSYTATNSSISFCMSSPPPPIPPGSITSRSIPFSGSSPLPPPPPPPPPPSVHPPGNPLHNSIYCPTVQHNMFGPYGTTLPSFSRGTDINTARPLMPPSRIGAPSVAPFPPAPFATPIPSRPQFS